MTGAELVAFVEEAVDAGGLAVFQFHGVGGEWIPISRDAHQELVRWLAVNRATVWTDTFRSVMEHVIARQQRRAAP